MTTGVQIFISEIGVFESYINNHKPVFVDSRDFCSLTYRHRGKISIQLDGSEYFSSADTVTFVPRGAAYTTEVFEDTYITGIHFNFIGADTIELPTIIESSRSSHIYTLFQSLAKTINDPSSHYIQISLFYELLHELERESTRINDKLIPRKISKAKEIIEREFSDSLFSIDVLASKINVSTTYLRREFNRAYGISPIGYLKSTRINRAMQMLTTQSLTVTKIAEQCGYSSTSYFIQDFHKIIGESPTQYKSRLIATP